MTKGLKSKYYVNWEYICKFLKLEETKIEFPLCKLQFVHL